MTSPRKVILAPAAEEDIAAILGWSVETFGDAASRRYGALIVQAIMDLAKQPTRAGVHERPEISVRLCSYHLAHSRVHIRPVAERVASPRHFVMFRIRNDGGLEIVRILHDSMDLARYVPKEEAEK